MVGEGVTMIDALRQKTYTREEVIKKMGVPPEKIPDFLALVGDTSDNIPGHQAASATRPPRACSSSTARSRT